MQLVVRLSLLFLDPLHLPFRCTGRNVEVPDRDNTAAKVPIREVNPQFS